MTDFNSKKQLEQNDTLPTWGWLQDRSIALAGAEDFRVWLAEQLEALVCEHESWITPNSLKRELSNRGISK